jgi:hypothetical protein
MSWDTGPKEESIDNNPNPLYPNTFTASMVLVAILAVRVLKHLIYGIENFACLFDGINECL